MPCEIESNGRHKGLNIIGATEILGDYKFYYSSQPSREGIKARHVGSFLDKLIAHYPGKEVYIIWDNLKLTRFRRHSRAMQRTV